MTQRAPAHVRPSLPAQLSADRIERALPVMAYIVLRHGEQYGPLLEWMEEELENARKGDTYRHRAERILAGFTREPNFAPAP